MGHHSQYFVSCFDKLLPTVEKILQIMCNSIAIGNQLGFNGVIIDLLFDFETSSNYQNMHKFIDKIYVILAEFTRVNAITTPLNQKPEQDMKQNQACHTL